MSRLISLSIRGGRIAATLSVAALLAATTPAAETTPPSPSEFIGFTLGADRQLADYKQIVSYLEALDRASDRLELRRLGPSTLGSELMLAVISSPENLRQLERYRTIARRLADPRGLSTAQSESLVSEGKVLCLVTGAIHSSEIAATQMFLEWAHALVTAEDPETLRRLDRVILLIIPSLNPDGHQLVTAGVAFDFETEKGLPNGSPAHLEHVG